VSSFPQSEVPVGPVTGTEEIPSASRLRGNSQIFSYRWQSLHMRIIHQTQHPGVLSLGEAYRGIDSLTCAAVAAYISPFAQQSSMKACAFTPKGVSLAISRSIRSLIVAPEAFRRLKALKLC
jgi:hypothetical protein